MCMANFVLLYYPKWLFHVGKYFYFKKKIQESLIDLGKQNSQTN